MMTISLFLTLDAPDYATLIVVDVIQVKESVVGSAIVYAGFSILVVAGMQDIFQLGNQQPLYISL